jgi:hypothetical protein
MSTKDKVDDDVPRVDGRSLTLTKFLSEYAHRPFVMTNATSEWGGIKGGGADPFGSVLRNMFPDDPVVPITHGSASYVSTETSRVKLSEFLSKYRSAYLKDWHVHPLNGPNERIYVTPKQFRGPSMDWLNLYCSTHPDGKEGFKFLYAGRANTFTPMHHDVLCSFSWSANIVGTKKWILFDPEQSKLLFDRHNRDVIPDITKLCPSKYPNAHRAKPIHCVQQAGEVMYVPSGYYHQVLNLTDCISVNHNGLQSENAFAAWRFLRKEYVDSKHAIEHLESTYESVSAFESEIQRVMRVDCGFDVSKWIDMLRVVASRCSIVFAKRLEEEIQLYSPKITHVSDLARISGLLTQKYPKCTNARAVCYEVLVRQRAFQNMPVIFFSKSRVSNNEEFLPPEYVSIISFIIIYSHSLTHIQQLETKTIKFLAIEGQRLWTLVS